MAIEVFTEQQGQVCILAIGGRLDADGAVDLELALQELEAAGVQHYVFDMAGLIYASSAGVKVLTGLADRLRGKGSARLAGVPLALREIFGQADITQRFKVYLDRRAALTDHPQARVDPALLAAATSLIGAGKQEPEESSAPSELSQAVARLLGAKTAPGKPETAKRNATPLPLSRQPQPGLAGRIKRWLGPKE